MPSPPLDPLVVHRVLGSRPYAEIGRPFLAARDDRSGVLAVAGYLGGTQWPGRDASEGARGLLRLDGQIADPLSLAVVGPARVVVGTVDGRIAECAFGGAPGTSAPESV